jgi:hypothetical protein
VAVEYFKKIHNKPLAIKNFEMFTDLKDYLNIEENPIKALKLHLMKEKIQVIRDCKNINEVISNRLRNKFPIFKLFSSFSYSGVEILKEFLEENLK